MIELYLNREEGRGKNKVDIFLESEGEYLDGSL